LIGNDENGIQGHFEILSILSADILKMAAILSRFYMVRIFYQHYLIYMPSLVEIPSAVSDHRYWNWEPLMILQIISFLVIIIIILPLLLLAVSLSDQILRD
jgi:hypothetical protein